MSTEYLEKYQTKHFTKEFITYFGESLKNKIGCGPKQIKMKWNGWNIELKIPTDYFTSRVMSLAFEIIGKQFNENSIVINPKRMGIKNRIYNIMLIHDKDKGNNPYIMYWYQYHSKYELPIDLLGKKINLYGHSYIIKGLNPFNKKYPVKAEKIENGKPYKISVYQVKTGLQRSK